MTRRTGFTAGLAIGLAALWTGALALPVVSHAQETLAEAAASAEAPPEEPAETPVAEETVGPRDGAAARALAPPLLATTEPIEQAWFGGDPTLEARVWRTRRAALERGIWNVDGAARALLATPRVPLERAEAAVRLAPDLPAAQMEWARARWLDGDSPISALRTAGGALVAFARHPEGALWLGGSLLGLLAAGLVYGGLLALAVACLLVTPHAAHDLADLFSRRMPAFGRAALLTSLLLVPAVLGEGVLGLAVALIAVGAVYGSRRQRVALAVSCAAIVLGAFPVARLAGMALEALPADPVARAALATSRGLVLPEDVRRLEAAAEHDPLARQGLARLARRAGNLGRADAAYQALVKESPEDPVILNNAANVRLHLGHMESAFDLYRRALAVDQSAVVLYNLSQAQGRAFQVDDLTRTLEIAQSLDGDLVADLTRLQGAQPEGFVVDLPISNWSFWRRVLRSSNGAAWAAELRAPVAPGRLGESPAALGGAFASALVLGLLLGSRVRASCWCSRCGQRVCPRCHPEVSRGELCAACNKLFYQPELTNRSLRLRRIEALRDRGARYDRVAWLVSIVLPGAAGVLARRPLLGVWGAVWFVVALGALLGREGAAPDPLVAGAAGPVAFFVVAVLAGLGYALTVGASLAARRYL